MKNKKTRVALLLSVFVMGVSLVTVLIVSAEQTEPSDTVTVEYANGTVVTLAEGEEILPIDVPKDFVKLDGAGNAYLYTVAEEATWTFTLDGEALAEMTVTADMLGKTVKADVAGVLGTERVFFSIHENIKDETVPEEYQGEFDVYGYSEEELIKYLSRENDGGNKENPRYRYLRQRDNEFHVTLYADMYPVKFDPRWGSANKDWMLPNKDGTDFVEVQDRTWRGTYDADGNPTGVSGTSATVYFNLNGHTLEIGAAESFHFGSMACTPYSMRLYFYSTVPGAVFSGTKSQAVFYSDDDSAVYVGELNSGDVKYGRNLSVYGKMVAHVNYGGGVYLWGGRYYQAGANPDFINISHRLYEVKNCEFYVADQSEALIFFNDGQKHQWSEKNSAMKFENCVFYVGQHGTKLIREVSSQNKDATVEKPPQEIEKKYSLTFKNCEFYGIPTQQSSNYLTFKYTGETVYSVGTDQNYGTADAPIYLAYVVDAVKTRELTDINGNVFTASAFCDFLPAEEVFCINYQDSKTYWQPGRTPFVYDNVVMTDTERYVESEGYYIGIPEVLEAGQVYVAKGIAYGKKTVVAFIYTLSNGSEAYGLEGATDEETGRTFAEKLGNYASGRIVLYSDILLTKNVDFGTKGEVALDMNGHKITVAENASIMGAVHRIGDGMALSLYSSRPGAIYENLSSYPIFSLSHGGKGGKISIGDYMYTLNDKYSGDNIKYISAGSFFIGYPVNEGVTAESRFTAMGGTYVYTGSFAAFVVANDFSIEHAKLNFRPKEAGAKLIAFATRADTKTTATVSSCSLYAEPGTQVTDYTVLDMTTAVPATELAVEQKVTFARCGFYGVSGKAVSGFESLELGYTLPSFYTLEALRNFYDDNYPENVVVARSSAEFLINGKLDYIPLWTCAESKNVATVTFVSGVAGVETFTEDWVIGFMACHESFVVGDIFVFDYGKAKVEANGTRRTAKCKSLVAGTVQINLSFTGTPYFNLWIPKDTCITSVAINGVETRILPILDYSGDYYLVRTAITPDLLFRDVNLTVQTAERKESMKFKLSTYIEQLLDSSSISVEEKQAIYALVEYAKNLGSATDAISPPRGYATQYITEGADAPLLSGPISDIAFDFMNGGALKVSGISGKTVVLETADGLRFEKMIKAGTCIFDDVPLYAFIGNFTLACEDSVYTYSLTIYNAMLPAKERVKANVLYTYIYYADRLHAVSVENSAVKEASEK